MVAFFSFGERKQFAASLTIPQGVRIFIGQRVSATGKAEFKSYTAATPPTFPYQFSWYTLHYTVGQLLIRVDAVRSSTGKSMVATAAQAAHAINQLTATLPMIWPYLGAPVSWPPKYCIDDAAMLILLDNMKIVEAAKPPQH